MAEEISQEMIAVDLPMDIITDIISRFPVESLLRFRCVSKQWCSLIDTSDFAKLHLNRSIKTKSNLSLILGNWKGRSIHCVSFDKLDKAVEVENPLKEPVAMGSCNGLLLLDGTILERSLILYNPATRMHKVIPYCPNSNDHVMRLGIYGLGYDALNDDYKVISVAGFSDTSGQWIGNGIRIYSLNKSDKWKPMKGGFRCGVLTMRGWGVHLKGSLHTPAKRNVEGKCLDSILVTDLCKEDFGFMELPCFREEDVDKLTLYVLGVEEYLCCETVYNNARTDFWVMNKYGVRSSWTMLFSVSPMDLPPSSSLDVLTFSKEYDKVLCTLNYEKLCWYDLKSKTFIDVPVEGLPKADFAVGICVGSLVRPDGFGKFKEGQTKKKRDDFLSKGFKLKL